MAALFHKAGRSPDQQRIRQLYVKIFCYLVTLGKGRAKSHIYFTEEILQCYELIQNLQV
jgi:hypothetical protein